MKISNSMPKVNMISQFFFQLPKFKYLWDFQCYAVSVEKIRNLYTAELLCEGFHSLLLHSVFNDVLK